MKSLKYFSTFIFIQCLAFIMAIIHLLFLINSVTILSATPSIEFIPAIDQKSSFEFHGQIANDFSVANLVIHLPRHNFDEQFSQIMEYLKRFNFLRDDTTATHILRVQIREASHALELCHDLHNDITKRSWWGPVALAVGFVTGGISTAALSTANANANDISQLQSNVHEMFQTHKLAINNHAQQIETLHHTDEQLLLLINGTQFLLKLRTAQFALLSLTKDIEHQNHIETELLAGHMPPEILSTEIIKASKKLIASIRSSNKALIPHMSINDLALLPFSSSFDPIHGYIIVIHFPVFPTPKPNILQLYRYSPSPWNFTKNNVHHIFSPIDFIHDTIAISDNSGQIESHSLWHSTNLDKCPSFKGIALCPQHQLTYTHFRFTCLGSIFAGDLLNALHHCAPLSNFKSPQLLRTTSNSFRIMFPSSTTVTTFINDFKSQRLITRGIYDIQLPPNAWIKSKYFFLRHSKSTQSEKVIVSLNTSDKSYLDEYEFKSLSLNYSKPATVSTTFKLLPQRHSNILLIVISIIASISFIIIIFFLLWVYYDYKKKQNSTPQTPQEQN